MNSSDTQTDELPAGGTADESTEKPKPKLSLEVKVQTPSACQRHVTVTVSREDIDRYFSEQFDALMPEAEVPGFRKGRAPRKLVENKLRHYVTDQVKGKLLLDSMTQVSQEQDFSAISEPDFDFDAIEVPADGPMTFEFDLEVRPEFELPQWKGLRLEKPVWTITQEDIDRHLKNLLSPHGVLAPCEEAAQPDDYVTVNLTCRHGGAVVSVIEEQTMRIRPKLSFRDGTLKGFDKLMVGVEAGDVKQTTLKLSADAENEQLRGQEVEVEFAVLDVKRLELPELDAAMLDRVGGFQSEEQLRDAVGQELERQLAYHQSQRVREQITSLLTESADWELPPELLRRQTHRELERMVMEMQTSGFSNEQIRARENELSQNSRAVTERALKEHFILERIAEEEQIEEAPDDYDREIALIAAHQGDSPRRVRARLEKRGLMDTLRNQIIERKTIDLITSYAEFREVKFKPPVGDTEAVDLAIGGGRKPSEIPEAKPGGQPEELRQPVDRS